VFRAPTQGWIRSDLIRSDLGSFFLTTGVVTRVVQPEKLPIRVDNVQRLPNWPALHAPEEKELAIEFGYDPNV